MVIVRSFCADYIWFAFNKMLRFGKRGPIVFENYPFYTITNADTGIIRYETVAVPLVCQVQISIPPDFCWTY